MKYKECECGAPGCDYVVDTVGDVYTKFQAQEKEEKLGNKFEYEKAERLEKINN